jgi:hypothetical protein
MSTNKSTPKFREIPSKDEETEDGSSGAIIMIDLGQNQGQRGSSSNINARRSGSASILVRDEQGTVKVERKNTGTDIITAAAKRMSDSSLPNILSMTAAPFKPPLLGAEDALERCGGKGAAGAFSEHLFPLEKLTELFGTHLDVKRPENSRGLSKGKAAEVLAELGLNVLTPPPRVPLWLLFLL